MLIAKNTRLAVIKLNRTRPSMWSEIKGNVEQKAVGIQRNRRRCQMPNVQSKTRQASLLCWDLFYSQVNCIIIYPEVATKWGSWLPAAAQAESLGFERKKHLKSKVRSKNCRQYWSWGNQRWWAQNAACWVYIVPCMLPSPHAWLHWIQWHN